jgi:hypothetical protein
MCETATLIAIFHRFPSEFTPPTDWMQACGLACEERSMHRICTTVARCDAAVNSDILDFSSFRRSLLRLLRGLDTNAALAIS